MKRRNFLTVLAVALLVPWQDILPCAAKPELPVPMPATITRLSNVGEGFRVGDLITVHGTGDDRDGSVFTIIAREKSDIFITEEPDESKWPNHWYHRWNNLARHA